MIKVNICDKNFGIPNELICQQGKTKFNDYTTTRDSLYMYIVKMEEANTPLCERAINKGSSGRSVV